MAIFSSRTRSKTNSTYRSSPEKIQKAISEIQEYKPNEVIEDVLSRPFDQIKVNFTKLYQLLYSRGINV